MLNKGNRIWQMPHQELIFQDILKKSAADSKHRLRFLHLLFPIMVKWVIMTIYGLPIYFGNKCLSGSVSILDSWLIARATQIQGNGLNPPNAVLLIDKALYVRKPFTTDFHEITEDILFQFIAILRMHIERFPIGNTKLQAYLPGVAKLLKDE